VFNKNKTPGRVRMGGAELGSASLFGEGGESLGLQVTGERRMFG